MKQEEINSIWETYNRKLDQNLRFNQELLRKINLDQLKRELSKPRLMEIMNVVSTFLFALYLIVLSSLLFDQARFSVTGFVAAGSTLSIMAFSLIRITGIYKIDPVNQSILSLEKAYHRLVVIRTRIGMVELVCTIISLVCMWPIILFTGFNIDVFEQVSGLFIALLICALVVVPLAIWHEKFYRRRLANAGKILQEINQLENS